MPRSRVRITVLKRVEPEYIFDGEVPLSPTGEKYTVCTAFEDGQEFILEKDNKRPEGFCPWAFHDIFKDAHILMFGGNFTPWTPEGTQITCCSDGIRPVSFKLERMDELPR